MTTNYAIILVCLAACDLGPRGEDPPDAEVPNNPGETQILPPGTAVPSIETNPELLIQIRINDGLVDATLMMNNNVVVRSTGKANGLPVRYWNFGAAPVESGFSVLAPLYVFGTVDDGGVFTPLPNHPQLIDTLPGDIRYSPFRRVINVPITPLYKGELITSMAALDEALQKGLVGEPMSDLTWMNLPVVLPGTLLELGGVEPNAPPRQVYGRGYRVDVFELGTSLGRQPFRSNLLPVGQASSLQTGVATGSPPTLPVAVDAQPVFQYGIPTMPPGMTFSYSPVTTEITVRLANGVAPAMIMGDADLFRRSATGAITSYRTDTVSTFTVGTVVNNLQLQFTEGSP